MTHAAPDRAVPTPPPDGKVLDPDVVPDLAGYPEGTTYGAYRVEAHASSGVIELPWPHSINDAVATQPKLRRYTGHMKGWLVLLPRTGLVVVPVARKPDGWDCIVVHSANIVKPDGGGQPYGRGGYNIWVGDEELRGAVEIPVLLNGRLTDDDA